MLALHIHENRRKLRRRYSQNKNCREITQSVITAWDRARRVMRVLVNGTPQDILPGTRLNGLLAQLAIAPDRVAIELNLTIVDRQALDTPLNEGDKIEIINFVGGGCPPTGGSEATAPAGRRRDKIMKTLA